MAFNEEIRKKAREVKAAAYESMRDEIREDCPPGVSDIELQPQVEGMFDYIPELFEPYARDPLPQLDEIHGILGGLDSNLGKNGGLLASTRMSTDLGLLAAEFVEWESPAGEAFRENFLWKFSRCVDNQRRLVEELVVGLDIMRDIVRKTQEDTIKVADHTIEALIGGGSGVFKGDLVTAGLSILTAATLGAGSVPMALVGAGGSLAGKAIDSKASNRLISGGFTVDKLNSMSKALSDIYDECSRKGSDLATELNKDIGTIEEVLKRGPNAKSTPIATDLLPLRPDFADGYVYKDLGL